MRKQGPSQPHREAGLTIEGFDYEITHTPGVRMKQADALSRPPDMPSSSQGAEGGTLSASGTKQKRMLSLIKRLPKKVKAQINPHSAIE
ncbi:hypothetical protein CEXT_650361 [Caerostris extrusa]|uniref:Uncharacterized protein n=1 Tax=Caerostris extrusa TaxID=172846 RepID=A0AAV4MZQ6_CAEEX|nr:hypothetical protein CEXT_650361 [Caerostris extrusa]